MLTDHLSRGSEEEFVADVVRTGFWRSDTTEDPYAMRHPNADCRRTLEALAMLPDAADILPAGDTVQLDARGLRFITLPLCDHLPLCDARFLILTSGLTNTKYTYFKNTIKYSIIHNTQDPDFVFCVSFYIYTYILDFYHIN